MRTRVFIAGALVSLSTGAIVACVDLFHSTSDVQSICELDASDPRCTDAPVPVEICAPDAGVAQQRAVHACSWLAACGHPLGRNKTGTCMVDAILAYDCAANPNRKAKGAAKDFWTCMQTAKTCSDVDHCVFPEAGRSRARTATFVGCSQSAKTPTRAIDCVRSGPARRRELRAPRSDVQLARSRRVEPQRALRRTTTAARARARAASTGAQPVRRRGGRPRLRLRGCRRGKLLRRAARHPRASRGPRGTCAATNDVTCTSGNLVAKGCVTLIPETVDCTAISGTGTCVPIEGGALRHGAFGGVSGRRRGLHRRLVRRRERSSRACADAPSRRLRVGRAQVCNPITTVESDSRDRVV